MHTWMLLYSILCSRIHKSIYIHKKKERKTERERAGALLERECGSEGGREDGRESEQTCTSTRSCSCSLSSLRYLITFTRFCLSFPQIFPPFVLAAHTQNNHQNSETSEHSCVCMCGCVIFYTQTDTNIHTDKCTATNTDTHVYIYTLVRVCITHTSTHMQATEPSFFGPGFFSVRE